MGRELNLQAIPEDSELIQISKQDVEFGELLSLVNGIFKGRALFPGQEDTTSRLFEKKAKMILKSKPNIGERKFYDVGRRYDQINYLLCEKRRLNSTFGVQYSPIYIAIYGNMQIHPEIKSVQGFDITLVTADYVSKIVAHMKEIKFKEFKRYWHPYTMWEFGVYKADPSMDERELVFCWNEFQRMLSFYESVEAHNEAVLTWIT